MAKVTVEIEGIDNVSKPFKEGAKAANDFGKAVNTGGQNVADSNKQVGFSFTELTSAIGLAKQAYQVVGQVVSETVGVFQEYAGEVRDLSLITGTGAEETSRFIQVIDDYQLSAQDAEIATKALKEKGLVPTIDTLARLADQYKRIEDPAQRMKFVQDNLGKGGAKWVNVLNQEGEALRKTAGEIDKSLVLTDEQIKQSEELRLAQDALADSIEGIKVATGAWIGTQILAVKHTGELLDAYKSLGNEVGGAQRQSIDFQENFKAFTAQMKQGAAATEYYNSRLEQTSQVTEEASAMTEEMNKALQKSNADLIAGAREIMKSDSDFAKKQEELQQKNVDILEQRFALTSAGWSTESEKVKELDAALEENNNAILENSAIHAEASRQKLLDMSLEAIALSDGIAGFSAAEAERAQVLLQTADAGAAAAFKEQQAFVTASQAIAAGTLDAKELDATLKMMAKGYTLDVVLNTISNMSQGALASNGQSGYSLLAGNNAGFADGGISTGSPSGHMEMLHGTEAVIPLEGGSIPVQVQGVGNSNSIDVTGIINAIYATRIDQSKLARDIVSATKREM